MVAYLLSLLSFVLSCQAYNVLVIIPLGVKSHFINMRPIALELAARGHNVTVISGVKEIDPPENYTHVDTYYKIDFKLPNMFEFEYKSASSRLDTYREICIELTENSLRSEGVQKFVLEHQHFDLVISEQLYNEAYNLLAFKHNCPLILVSTFGHCMKHNIVVGNPLQLRYLHNEYLRIETFDWWSLVLNLYTTLYEYVNWKYWYLSLQEDMAKKYLKIPDDAPSLYSIQKNAVLLLMNRHYNFETPTAFLPNLIEVGGIHFSHNKEQTIDEDLKKHLANPHGTIYVSFGSSFYISQMPTSKKEALFGLFRKLKQTVLLRNDKELEDFPKHIVMRSWFPQREVLNHPNMKLFITHGGIHSVLEAVWSGVPILGIPVFADQNRNVLQAEKHGVGKVLLYRNIEVELETTVNDMLNNKSYKANAIERSHSYKDRQFNPLDVATSHIERVLKHRDIYMNKENDFDWLDFYLVDLFVLLLMLFVVFASVFMLLLKYLLRMFRKVDNATIKGKRW